MLRGRVLVKGKVMAPRDESYWKPSQGQGNALLYPTADGQPLLTAYLQAPPKCRVLVEPYEMISTFLVSHRNGQIGFFKETRLLYSSISLPPQKAVHVCCE